MPVIRGSVDDDGLADRIQEAINTFVPQQLADLNRQIAEGAISQMTYPEEPTSMGYKYYRGIGTINLDGSISGKGSEKVNESWGYREESRSAEEAVGVVYNTATYSAHLHYEGRQVSWAKERGWPTIQAALRSQVGESTESPVAIVTAEEIEAIGNTANVIASFIGKDLQ